MENDNLIKHGIDIIEVERTFDGMKQYLEENYIEGIVFWKEEPKSNSMKICNRGE